MTSYSASVPNQPPLGYIVAYTPEQVADLMRDQYHGDVSPQQPSSASSQDLVTEHRGEMEEIERRLLEQKLHRQQKESAADARWLQEEEEKSLTPVQQRQSTISTDEDSQGSVGAVFRDTSSPAPPSPHGRLDSTACR